MNDINDQKTAEQQAFSEEIRRRLAEPGSGKPTLDEFKVMVYKDREKRRKKRNALVACIVAAFIVGYLTYDDLVPEVGADKNPKETIKTEDGVVIEDGGWGSSTGEDDVWLVTEWKDVKETRETYKNMLIPTYVPEGYKFKHLEINNFVKNDFTAEYLYYKGSNALYIEVFSTENEHVSLEIEEVSKSIPCQRGTIYFQTAIKTATIQVDDGNVINICSDLPEAEIIQIINGLEN